jgi:hypothetical protein
VADKVVEKEPEAVIDPVISAPKSLIETAPNGISCYICKGGDRLAVNCEKYC